MANGCDNNDYIAVPGPQGLQGVQGPAGPVGPTGPTGATGPMGPQGPQGCQGPKGDRGARGEQGPKGERGNDGRDGAQGPPGPEGPRGCTGADGRVAFEDLTEQQREMLRGETGPQGPQGEAGPVGPQGPQGATGSQGPKGDTGSVGPQGREGVAGPVGPVGPMGPRGLKGDPGAGLDHSDLIGEDTTWNSKTIVEYATHGKVKWVEQQVYQEGVHNTANGFAKDLVVHGKTVVNYVNNEDLKVPLMLQEETAKVPKTIYTKKDNISELAKVKARTSYTLIYDMTILSTEEGLHEGDKAQIVVKGTQTPTTTYALPINEGRNKLQFDTVGEQPNEITVQFYQSDFSDPQATRLVFKIENVMLLVGDYTQKVAPRYFWDTRGVGDRIKDAQTGEKKRQLTIESRGKNLINMAEVQTDKYLHFEPSGGSGQGVTRWLQGKKGDSVSFLVYCKQKDYTLSVKVKDSMDDQLRFFVAGYSDTPTNGQPADAVYFKEVSVTGDYVSRTFRPTSEINVLAIYVANLNDPRGTEHHPQQFQIKDVIDYIQLEESAFATPYEQYRSVTKTMILPRALMNDDTFEWDDQAGCYAIHNKATPTQWELTDNKSESFINTFEGMTYLYVKNKIPSIVTAKFPISIQGENYYTKDEWQFKGLAEPHESEENSNILKLPNGCFMQWREIKTTLYKNSIQNRKVHFLHANKIIYAHAVPAGLAGGQTGWYSRVIAEIDPQEPHVVNLYLDDGYGQDQQEVRVTVFIISDNRDPLQP